MKQLLIIWLAIYPIITILSYLLGPYLAEQVIPLRTLVMTLIIVPIMVKLAIPFSRRLVEEVEGRFQGLKSK